MSRNIRSRAPGATRFFTVRLQDHNSDLLVREIDRLRAAMRAARTRRPFRIDAIAVLPAAIHTLWTLPPGDTDFATRWALICTHFERDLPPAPRRTPGQVRRGDKAIWQHRYWELRIESADELAEHRQMIHDAPVHAGLAARPQDWNWTSLHRDLACAEPAAEPLAPPAYSRMPRRIFRRRPLARAS